MTVTVTLPDGGADRYMRFGDTYVQYDNGTLDVVRTGAQEFHYASGAWTDVEGDQKSWKKARAFAPAPERDASCLTVTSGDLHCAICASQALPTARPTNGCTVKGVGNPATPG